MNLNAISATWAPRLLSILRIVAGVLFLEHGTQKLFGFPVRMGGGSAPALFTLFWFAAILEIVGGAMIILGLFTRPVAFILSGQMAFAYFIAHAPKSPFPALNGGGRVHSVLLPLPLPRRRGRRSVEPRRAAPRTVLRPGESGRPRFPLRVGAGRPGTRERMRMLAHRHPRSSGFPA